MIPKNNLTKVLFKEIEYFQLLESTEIHVQYIHQMRCETVHYERGFEPKPPNEKRQIHEDARWHK